MVHRWLPNHYQLHGEPNRYKSASTHTWCIAQTHNSYIKHALKSDEKISLPNCTFTTHSPEVIRSTFGAALYTSPGLAVPALGPARAGAVAGLRPALQEGGEVQQLLQVGGVRNSKRISFGDMYLLRTDSLSHTGSQSMATCSAPHSPLEHQAWAQFGNISVQELFPNASIDNNSSTGFPPNQYNPHAVEHTVLVFMLERHHPHMLSLQTCKKYR